MSETSTEKEEALKNQESSAAEQAAPAEGASLDPEAALTEWKNKVAYLAAEIDNMKKRFVRERAETIKMANEDLIKGLLPVFDNLFLGLRSIKQMENQAELQENKIVANLLKGVEMTLTHFEQTLDRMGVKPLDSVGKPFDPNHHEAMGESSDKNFEDGVVSSEFQKGFSLHGRVIRPARVIVNKLPKA